MPVYTLKLYPNEAGEARTFSVQCSDQLAAIEQAELHHSNCRNVEIWLLDRLVAEVNCCGVIKLMAEPSGNVVPHVPKA